MKLGSMKSKLRSHYSSLGEDLDKTRQAELNWALSDFSALGRNTDVMTFREALALLEGLQDATE